MNDVIFGKNAIREALISEDRTIDKILILNSIHTDKKISEIKDLARQKKVVFQFAGKEKFAPYKDYNHQGIIALVSPIEYTDLYDFIETHQDSGNLVLLDGVEDPHNLGAIIRSCVCAGIDGIIIPSRKSAPINMVVEKASAGAINKISIIKVNSPVSVLQELKENNWWVIAAEADADDNYFDIDYCNSKFVLVMGGEHSGVSRSIMNLADFKIKIPMLRDFNSLNVSNATCIILYEYVRQKLTK